MIEFTVTGPYEIGYKKSNKVKRIYGENTVGFWDNCPVDLENQRGCYVFALRKRSIVPYYVGKASLSFSQEIFTPHKIEKYNDVLHSHTFGNPVLYFVSHPLQKGKTNEKAIDEIETYLIQSALIVNPEIRNIQKKRLPTWTIRNVIKQARGKSKASEISFTQMLRLT